MCTSKNVSAIETKEQGNFFAEVVSNWEKGKKYKGRWKIEFSIDKDILAVEFDRLDLPCVQTVGDSRKPDFIKRIFIDIKDKKDEEIKTLVLQFLNNNFLIALSKAFV